MRPQVAVTEVRYLDGLPYEATYTDPGGCIEETLTYYKTIKGKYRPARNSKPRYGETAVQLTKREIDELP